MAEMDRDLIIARLQELRSMIREWERRGIGAKHTPEFKVWKANVEKWLSLRRSATGLESKNFKGLVFQMLHVDPSGYGGFDAMDQELYSSDLTLARTYINSAIEKLELGQESLSPRSERRDSSGDGGRTT